MRRLKHNADFANNVDNSTYFSIVAANALKEGKKPEEVINKIRKNRTAINLSDGEYISVNKALTAWLKKRGYRPRYNSHYV